MIIDCQNLKSLDELNHRVFVDGVEIHLVHYVDTEGGFVRTFDVLEDKKVHATSEFLEEKLIAAARAKAYARGNPNWWDMPVNGVMSKTIRGVVTLERRNLENAL